mgnify:CR=1 FL=1
MPAVGFGTYLLSSEQCEDAVLHALNAGYRHIDTAEFYDNHRGCAKAIKASNVDRKDIWITDKVSPNGFFDMPCRTYDEVLAALRSRLSMLETEYVDLYLLHHAFAKDERLNQWRALVEAQKLGLAKHIGVSNWGEKHFKEIEEAGLPIPEVNQIEVHPICSQKDVIAYMKTKGITVVAYSSLAPLSTWRTEPDQSSLPIEDLSHQAVIAEVVSHYKDQDVSEVHILLFFLSSRLPLTYVP